MPLRLLAFGLAFLLGFHLLAQEPLTTAERSGYTETSTCADVETFLKALEKKPMAKRLHRTWAGKSGESNTIHLILAGEDPSAILARKPQVVRVGNRPGSAPTRIPGARNKPLVLVMANIHGGEVEGKEVVQILLREIADGRHTDLLEKIDLAFMPVYNTDGNDKISKKNRVSQNGPRQGVGQRANAQGLDLNRDFIKVESPECQALMRVFRDYDPEVFLDLHTTNGSKHGYHLTYATSTCTNVDPAISDFMTMAYLPEVKKECAENHLLRTFDYGNYAIQRLDRGWYTFDHRARFATNYYALRNRLSVLSEAYSYQPFEMRVMATRAFVLENLRAVARHGGQIKKLCANADKAALGRLDFPYDTHLAGGLEVEVLGAELEEKILEGLGKRYVVLPGFKRLKMPLRVVFESRKKIAQPQAWLLPKASAEVKQRLQAHGLTLWELVEDKEMVVKAFRPTKIRRAKRIFQKHYELRLEGDFAKEAKKFPAGTLVVSSHQRLSRVAAQLLSPYSEDGLATWNYFDDRIKENPAEGEEGFPVYRLEVMHWRGTEFRVLPPLR